MITFTFSFAAMWAEVSLLMGNLWPWFAFILGLALVFVFFENITER